MKQMRKIPRLTLRVNWHKLLLKQSTTMKALKIISLLAAALGVLLLAGCSTPETRIKKNPVAFARLTPTQQDLVKKGQVALGFDHEMVKLALGDPDHMRIRTDVSGTTEIWTYTTWETRDGVMLYHGYYHRYWGDPFYPYYMNYPGRRERDHTKVSFKDGKVISVEAEAF